MPAESNKEAIEYQIKGLWNHSPLLYGNRIDTETIMSSQFCVQSASRIAATFISLVPVYDNLYDYFKSLMLKNYMPYDEADDPTSLTKSRGGQLFCIGSKDLSNCRQ